jgi:CRP-like cAMP-binding protein
MGTGTAWPPRSFVGRLTESDRAELMRLGVPRQYGPSDLLFRQGEGSRHVVVLLSGHVKVTMTTPANLEALLAVRGRGDIVGELAAASGAERTATVAAAGRVGSRLIPQSTFDHYLADHPAAARHLVAVVGDKLSSADRSRADFVALPARARLAAVLCDLGAAFHGGTGTESPIRIRVTQAELASMAGIRDVTAQKELREMRAAGILVTRYGQIELNDIERLARLRETGDDDPGALG